jgi:hypothetical protein
MWRIAQLRSTSIRTIEEETFVDLPESQPPARLGKFVVPLPDLHFHHRNSTRSELSERLGQQQSHKRFAFRFPKHQVNQAHGAPSPSRGKRFHIPKAHES